MEHKSHVHMPSRLVGALGRGAIFHLIAAVAIVGVAAGILATGGLPITALALEGVLGAHALAFGIASLGAWAIGAITGWSHATRERQEIKGLIAERNEALSQNVALVQSVAPDLNPSQARFASKFSNRGASASFAESVQADRAVAPAEATR